MLPRLRAEEQLSMYSTLAAAGELSMEDGDRRAFVDSLEESAHGGRGQPAPAASLETLASWGMAVQEVPMPPAEPEPDAPPTQEPPGQSA